MKEIYIIMSHSGTFISNIIKFYTRAKYSHVSIGLDKSLTKFYSFGRKNPFSPIGGGFVQEGIDYGIYKLHKNARCKVYKLILTEEKYIHLKNSIYEFIEKQDEYKYNYIGIFTIMFGFKFNRKNYYFCSQFVAEILQLNQIIQFNKDFSLIRPTDFEKVEEAKLIFEGKVADYPRIGA